jgi:sugar (glycoside-pentoside-hexuronide) transporter
MAGKSKSRIEFITGKFERFSYVVYFFGQLIFYGIVTGFLSVYLTDSGIPAVVVSGIYIVAKVWDAVNDPIFGVIVDKARLKRGKYVPWVRMSSFLIPAATVLMFAMPAGASLQVKTIWAALAYMLWDASYTLCDVPIFALATSMTDRIEERDWLYLTNRFFSFLGALAVLVGVPLLYPNIGWTATAVILGVVGLATMLPVGFAAKERFHVDTAAESPSIGALVKYLLKNKYLLVFNGALIVMSITNTSAVVSNYVAIHLLGGEQWIAILSLVTALPTIVSLVIVNWIIKKHDKRIVFFTAWAFMLIFYAITYFVGYKNTALFLGVTALKSLATGGAAALQIMFTADCTEYGHFVTGERAQGVAFSIQTFTAKLTAALSAAIGMFILGLVGFKEGAGAVQTPETLDWLWRLNTLVPIISGFAAFLMIVFGYKLRTDDVKLMMKANNGEIAREEAIAGFSREYENA